MLNSSLGIAQSNPMKPGAAKTKLEERGVGRGIRVTLTDKTEVKGLIVSIGDDSCVLNTKGPDQPRTIAYASIASIHRDKMPTGEKVGISLGVVGVGIAVLVGVGAYMLTHWR